MEGKKKKKKKKKGDRSPAALSSAVPRVSPGPAGWEGKGLGVVRVDCGDRNIGEKGSGIFL